MNCRAYLIQYDLHNQRVTDRSPGLAADENVVGQKTKQKGDVCLECTVIESVFIA